MNLVHVLDCTLRDGGYCNQWKFGFENTKKITKGLVDSGIDIIECGFISDKVIYDKNVTKFCTIEQIADVIPKNRNNKLFVAMMNYGEYDINNLPVNNGCSIDGIRVAFHKKDLREALKICKKINEKGYKVFVQAMVSLCYSDEEFLELIKLVNDLEPYAFYIVDSFGMMKNKDLIRLFYMVEYNLKKDIWIGFHSHNNMQLAYSNAQTLVGLETNRNILIDSSIYGMGRGAGNLNTELFIQYLNENSDGNYELKPLLIVIDEILNIFYQKNYWGYSLPNYISAVHNAHPNYASFLDDKKTLTVEEMNEIFDMMDDEKKISYDKGYIENLYLNYMEMGRVQENHKEELKRILSSKKVILIAPGKTSDIEKKNIRDKADSEEVLLISVNFNYAYADPNYIFISNIRRFKELNDTEKKKCIVTSNIPTNEVFYKTPYKELINSIDAVNDNAGLMAINFLIQYGVEEIMLAGFDGYSHDVNENYADASLELITRNAVLDAMNIGMTEILKQYSQKVKITFLTTPKHVMI